MWHTDAIVAVIIGLSHVPGRPEISMAEQRLAQVTGGYHPSLTGDGRTNWAVLTCHDLGIHAKVGQVACRPA